MTAFTTTTPSLAAGDYLIGVFAEIQGGTVEVCSARATLDGDTDTDDLLAGPVQAGATRLSTMASMRRVTLTAATHTIAIQFKADGPAATVTIKHKRVVVLAL